MPYTVHDQSAEIFKCIRFRVVARISHHGGRDGPEDANGDPDHGENLYGRHPVRTLSLLLGLFLRPNLRAPGVEHSERSTGKKEECTL